MTKKEAWQRFKETGQIEYYLIYKGVRDGDDYES